MLLRRSGSSRGGGAARLPRPPARRARRAAPTSLALVPHGHLQGALRRRPARRVLPRPARPALGAVRDLPPALLDEHHPSWERAQPFRLLCHNGEINTIEGNVNWMRAREGSSGWTTSSLTCSTSRARTPRCSTTRSSCSSAAAAMSGMRRRCCIPEAWERRSELDPEVRDFYRYHAGLVEPWDGPAGVVFTDGRVVGAALDRNGLRPLRYAVGGKLRRLLLGGGRVHLPDARVRRGRLGPGEMLAVDPGSGSRRTRGSSARLARRRPYARWLASAACGRSDSGHARRSAAAEPDRAPGRCRLHAGGADAVLRPCGSDGHEPTSSMGDDTALPPLAGRARPLFLLLPPALRPGDEPADRPPARALLMSLRTLLGAARAAPRTRTSSGIGWSSSRASSSSRRPRRASAASSLSTPPAREREPRAARACALRTPQRGGRGRRRARHPRPARAPRRRSRRCSPSAPCTTRSSAPAGARATSLLVESDEPRDSAPLRLPARLRRRRVCPRLALETVAALAAATGSAATTRRRPRRSAASRMRSRTACSR